MIRLLQVTTVWPQKMNNRRTLESLSQHANQYSPPKFRKKLPAISVVHNLGSILSNVRPLILSKVIWFIWSWQTLMVQRWIIAFHACISSKQFSVWASHPMFHEMRINHRPWTTMLHSVILTLWRRQYSMWRGNLWNWSHRCCCWAHPHSHRITINCWCYTTMLHSVILILLDVAV